MTIVYPNDASQYRHHWKLAVFKGIEHFQALPSYMIYANCHTDQFFIGQQKLTVILSVLPCSLLNLFPFATRIEY